MPNTGATSCLDCGPRYHCPVGSSVRIPASCLPGTFLRVGSVYKNQSSCAQCQAGSWCPGGASAPTPCSPGFFATAVGKSTCDGCMAGTFQGEMGQTTCAVCTQGSYCSNGASAPLPCLRGSYSRATNLSKAANCTPTDPGHYATTLSTEQTPCTPGTVAPTRGMGTCDPCLAGTVQTGAGRTACEQCKAGSFCANASAAPLPCPAGRWTSSNDVQSAEECEPCWTGHSCSSGAVTPAECAPGTVQPATMQGSCEKCVPGKFMNVSGQTECHICRPGEFCIEASTAGLPCPSGRYQNSSLPVMRRADDCIGCPAGTFCSTGSVHPASCAPGTIQPQTEQGSCTKCNAGTFMSFSGQTACFACGPGSFCTQGAPAPLPCKAGRYGDALGLTSSNECTVCPRGAACSTGANTYAWCNPGTFADEPGMPMCALCDPGKYQPGKNATACLPCTVASFCPSSGSTAPTPCEAGRWSGREGLVSKAQCIKVVKGEWAPTRSVAPKQCPKSGFYCPGYDADEVNEQRGSEPIIVESGDARQTIDASVVTFDLELAVSLEEYDAQQLQLKQHLAQKYGVRAEDIALSLVADDRRRYRALQSSGSGLLRVRFTITPAEESSKAVAELIATVREETVAAAQEVMGGAAASLVSAPAERIIEKEVNVACPLGSWCSAGLTIECPAGTFANASLPPNQRISMGACLPCPAGATSLAGATNVDDCVCEPGKYKKDGACLVCPVGSNCKHEGTTLATLPVLTGHYRTSNSSDDLRRCPDFGPKTACVGGMSDGEGPCREWLRGPYCKLCNVTGAVRYYDAELSECLPCELDTMNWHSFVIGGAATLVLLLVALLLMRLQPHHHPRLQPLVGWCKNISAQLSLRSKGKQLLGFCMCRNRTVPYGPGRLA